MWFLGREKEIILNTNFKTCKRNSKLSFSMEHDISQPLKKHNGKNTPHIICTNKILQKKQYI